MNSRNDNTHSRLGALRMTAISAAIVGIFALPGIAAAFEIPTGNEDLAIRWDNTLRYNLGMRAQSQNEAILKNPNQDDGDRNFANGSLVTNRLDILSEFDFVFRKSYGFRVSAAGWYDGAYAGGFDNSSNLTSNTLVNGLPVAGTLSPYTKRYAKGASGEFLDWFGFASFETGGIPINVKLGQTSVYWGESLLSNGIIHGISYSQVPIDSWKSAANPGVEAKELYRPRVGFNVQAQVLPELSLAAQYFFNWQRFQNQSYRYAESGTYLNGAVTDGLNWGGDSFIAGTTPVAPGLLPRAWRGKDIVPEENTGNWGLAMRWSPEWADATIGAYFRRSYDMQPQQMLTPGVLPGVPASLCSARGGTPLPGNQCFVNANATTIPEIQKYGKLGLFNTSYGQGIDIFGLSLSKNIASVSVGAEVSYRHNMPLLSDPVYVLPAAFAPLVPGAIATNAVPEHGTPGALGDTMHGLVNANIVLPSTFLFDTASLAGELTWMTWLSVNQNEAVFKGRSNYVNAGCACTLDKVSKSYYGLAINFTPTWFQVFPGVDFLAPMAWNGGIGGNAAVSGGGNNGAGSYSLGVAADIYQRYRVDLKYVGYYSKYATNPTTGAISAFSGALIDRGWVALTFKMAF
jgi:hypothetical protein